MMLNQAFLKKLRGPLIRVAAGSSGLRLINIALSFSVSILLTRTLGVQGYGIYAYSMSWVMLLNIIAALGCQGLIVREVAANQAQQRWGLIRGLLQWSNLVILISSISVTAIFALIATQLQIAEPSTLQVLLIALILVPIMSLTILRQSTIQGFRHILKGQIVENVLQPASFVLMLVAIYILNQGELHPQWVMILRVSSSALAFIVGAIVLYKILPAPVKQSRPEYKTRQWTRSIMALLFVAGAGTIYTRSDSVMLGFMAGPESVGLYAVSLRGANFILMSQQIGAAVLGPYVAELYANGNVQQLQQLTIKSIRAVVTYAFPIALFLILFGPWFLKVFGDDFVQGQTVLRILSVSKLLTVAAGPVALLLNMSNHERDTAVAVGFGALLNIILNALLIPPFGAEGAAIATGSTAISVNIWLAFMVYKRLNIHCTIFSR